MVKIKPIQVHTYDDPVKELSREKQKNFIRRNNKFKNPKDVKVVCLPGAEVKGEEALEVKQVYDKLGIPRENIIGVERDPEIAERLRKANLGITVFEGSDLEWVLQTEGKYDIISFDYTGQQTRDNVIALKTIAGRQLLKPEGILMINYSGKRESRRQQASYLHRRLRSENKRQELVDLLKGFTPGTEKEQGYDLDELRDAVTSQILEEMVSGTYALYIPESLNQDDFIPSVFKALPNYDELIIELRRRFNEELDAETREAMKEFLTYAKVFTPEEFDSLQKTPEKILSVYELYMKKFLEDHLLRSKPFHELAKLRIQQIFDKAGNFEVRRFFEKFGPSVIGYEDVLIEEIIEKEGPEKRGIAEKIIEAMAQGSFSRGLEVIKNSELSRAFAELLTGMLIEQDMYPYFPRAIERFSYTSNKNTLMLGDMIAFYQPRKELNRLNSLFVMNRNTGKVSAMRSPAKWDYWKKLLKVISNYEDSKNPLKPENFPERNYLGCSWKTSREQKEQEFLTREEALLLMEDTPIKEICSVYANPEHQLRAWKAHKTMGTYQLA